jgi:hypothetical protein
MRTMVRVAVLALAASAAFLAPPLAMARETAGLQVAQLGESYGDRPVRRIRRAPIRRARTRIEVRPGFFEPVPPGTRRECVGTLVQEFRPSGTVIVPRQQCWWER